MQKYLHLIDLVESFPNRRRDSRERASQDLELIQFNYSFASVLGARWRAHSKHVQLHFPEKQAARHAMHPIYAPHPANDCEPSPSVIPHGESKTWALRTPVNNIEYFPQT